MSSNSSGYRVRRQLSFKDVPYRGKLFYVDIKAPSLKQKITRRIQDLGGQVESFLSKDLNLILTEGDEQKKTVPDLNKLQHIPLSRGQALLNASKDQKKDSNNNDILHRATILGVKTQTVHEFVKATAKFIAQIKAQKKTQKNENDISKGMSPISWDRDKENSFFLKIEDKGCFFRPLFKQFEKPPNLAFSETGSPFDVGVVLTKHNDNQPKNKTAKAPLKGGYCESCDHWYKSTLKEHLKSSKHKSFVSSVSNFKSLEVICSGLPNLKHFKKKFEAFSLNNNNVESTESLHDFEDICQTGGATQTPCDIVLSSKQSCFETSEKQIVNHELVSEERSNIIVSKDLKESHGTSSNNNTCSLLVDVNSNLSTTEKDNTKKEKIMTLDVILQDLLSENDQSEKGANSISDSHAKSGVISNAAVSDNVKNTKENVVNQVNQVNNGLNTGMDTVIRQQQDACVSRKKFVPEVNFSSSSCSFGDNGVGNVLTFLQQHGSEQTSVKPSLSSRNSVEILATEKSHSSQEFCMIKGSTASLQSVTSNPESVVPRKISQDNKFEQGKGSSLPLALESQHAKSIKHVITKENNKFNPYLENCDIMKLNQDNFKTSLVQTIPDYSNITEESLSSEIPKVVMTCSEKGYATNETPNKEDNEAFRKEVMRNVANSGSTWSSIRNWLLPTDDDVQPVVQSGEDLDKTMVETDCDKNGTENCGVSTHVVLKENTIDSTNNLVATWIQNQKFDVTEESEHFQSLNGFIPENDQQSSITLNGNIDKPSFSFPGKDKVTEVRAFNMIETLTRDNASSSGSREIGRADNVDDSNDDISECTSISDCTLENFKVDLVTHSAEDMADTSLKKNWDCMSEKSSLSCHMTERGIKIKGLQKLKNMSEKSSVLNHNLSHSVSEDISHSVLNNDMFEEKQNELLKNQDLTSASFRKQIQTNEAPCQTSEKVVFNSQTETKCSVNKDSALILMKEANDRKCSEINSDVRVDLSTADLNSNNDSISEVLPCHQENMFSFNHTAQPTKLCGNSNIYSPISQPDPQLNLERNCSFLQNRQLYVQTPSLSEYRQNVETNYVNNQVPGCNMNRNICNQNMTYGDYFMTGILPYDTQYASYSNGLTPFPTDPFSSSINETTDFLNLPSPRPDSICSVMNSSQSVLNYPQACVNAQPFTSVPYAAPFLSQSKNTQTENSKKPFSGKSKKCKTGKRKKNSKMPFESTSNFNSIDSVQLSKSSFPLGIVEQANSLQSDWCPSSPQSAVSSAVLSTIRLEDIAEESGQVNHLLNRLPVKDLERKVPNRNTLQTSKCQSMMNIPSNIGNVLINNSSTPYSQCYLSPQSAMLEKTNQIHSNCQIVDNSSYAHSKCLQAAPFSSQVNNQVPVVSNTYPAYLPGQSSQSNLSQVNMNTNNPYYYHQSTAMNHYPAYPVQSKHDTCEGKGSFHGNFHQPDVQKDKVMQLSEGYMYNAVQTGETRLKLRKVPSYRVNQQNDLKNYWNVRKAGDCRLVFSNPVGKRKAEEILFCDKNSDYHDIEKSQHTSYPQLKRRRCLVY